MQLVGLDDLVEQPELEGPAAREGLGGEQELHRRREGELAGQAHRRAAAGEQAALGLHHPERGVRRGDADVDAAEHLHAAGHAGPVDGGDDRLVELDVAQHGVGAVVAAGSRRSRSTLAGADLLRQLGDLRDVGLEVGAGHEAGRYAGDDRDPRVVVVAEASPRLGQVAEVVAGRARSRASGRSIVMTTMWSSRCS